MKRKGHLFDNDAVCVDCNFDAAEFSHWRNYTYEGKAQPEVKAPACTRGDRDHNQWLPREYELDNDEWPEDTGEYMEW